MLWQPWERHIQALQLALKLLTWSLTVWPWKVTKTQKSSPNHHGFQGLCCMLLNFKGIHSIESYRIINNLESMQRTNQHFTLLTINIETYRGKHFSAPNFVFPKASTKQIFGLQTFRSVAFPFLRSFFSSERNLGCPSATKSRTFRSNLGDPRPVGREKYSVSWGCWWKKSLNLSTN